MDIIIPNEVSFVMNKFSDFGFEAFIVGGCVRDILMNLPPHDFDITTNATPFEIKKIFNEFKTIETGIKHGTITVFINKFPIEITTYRIDGNYSDSRHPDKISFASSLKEDLSRRDFTINAMAYSPSTGIVDYFSGKSDLRRKVIKTVGNANKRFSEDALRILRALRFSSFFSFSIEEETSNAIIANKNFIKKVSAERINSEFTKMLCGQNIFRIFKSFSSVIEEFIPEITPMINFPQNTPYHIYDVWEHTLHSVENVEITPVLRLAMFFHDIGKPFCYTEDENGIGHFKGHAKISEEITNTVLIRLKYNTDTISSVTKLIKYHDLRIPFDEKVIKRWLNKLSPDIFMQLFKIKKADNLAKSSDFKYRISEIEKYENLSKKILAYNECFSLKQLAVNGKDLIGIGVREGKDIGIILDFLLNAVIDGKCENSKEKLICYTHSNFPVL